MPKGHDPDPVGRPRRPAVISGLTLAVVGPFAYGVGVAAALAAVTFAVVVVVVRAAASGLLRKL